MAFNDCYTYFRAIRYTVVTRPGAVSRIPPDSANVKLLPLPRTVLNEEQYPIYGIVSHANGRDLWLVFVSAPEGFRAIRFTPAGLDSAHAVVSPVGYAGQLSSATGYPRAAGVGQLLVSADQRTLLLLSTMGGLERFTFDPASGRVHSAVTLQPPLTDASHPQAPSWGYDSPNFPAKALSAGGRYAYQVRHVWHRSPTRGDTLERVDLWQYDARAPDSAAFRRSRQRIRSVAPPRYAGGGGIAQVTGWQQLFTGPDGRIYALRMTGAQRAPVD